MLSLFRRLMPKEERFFILFSRHTKVVLQGAEALQAMLAGGSDMPERFREVLALEDEADVITREVVQAVRRSFVTPFDRGNIQALISRMDDSIDQMKKTAKAVHLFGIKGSDPIMGDLQRMADAIVRCARLMDKAVPLLASIGPNAQQVNELCEAIRRIEGEADDIHDASVAELFRRCSEDGAGQDGLYFIARREVLDQIERVVDRFDDAANEVEGIVLEHV